MRGKEQKFREADSQKKPRHAGRTPKPSSTMLCALLRGGVRITLDRE